MTTLLYILAVCGAISALVFIGLMSVLGWRIRAGMNDFSWKKVRKAARFSLAAPITVTILSIATAILFLKFLFVIMSDAMTYTSQKVDDYGVRSLDVLLGRVEGESKFVLADDDDD